MNHAKVQVEAAHADFMRCFNRTPPSLDFTLIRLDPLSNTQN